MKKWIMSKLQNMITRCIVELQESTGHQVTLLHGETVSDMEHLQEFGFASMKPDGKGNGICLFLGGERSNGTLMVVEFPSYKPTLKAGETAVFNAHEAYIKLLEQKIIELNGNNFNELIKIDELTAKLNAHIAEYNAHMHAVAASLGSPSPPTVSAAPFVKMDYANPKVVHGG